MEKQGRTAGTASSTGSSLAPLETAGPELLPLFKEAIRRIKDQKQRPGFDRMLVTLKTYHDVHDATEVRRQLDLAVSSDLLLTVHTKGLLCYMDPDSRRGLRRTKMDSDLRVQAAVQAAVREIGDPEGSSLEDVERYVRLTFTIRISDLRERMQQALSKLVRKGVLNQPSPNRFSFCTGSSLPNDAHHLTAPSDTPVTTPPAPSTSTPTLLPVPPKRKPGRPKRITPPPASAPPTGEAPPVPAKSGAAVAPVVVRRAGRRDQEYVCGACHVHTARKSALLQHVTSREHRAIVSGKMVQCDTCRFRSRNVDKLAEHLQRHGCHAGKSVPSSMLSRSTSNDLLVE